MHRRLPAKGMYRRTVLLNLHLFESISMLLVDGSVLVVLRYSYAIFSAVQSK